MFSNGSFGMLPVMLAAVDTSGSEYLPLWRHLLAAVVFALVGIAVLGLCFWLMKKFAPFSIAKEIEEDQNTALAIVMGSVIIGISIIIAAAIHG